MKVRGVQQAFALAAEIDPAASMNKLERAWLDEVCTPHILAKEWVLWRYEDIRLRIGSRADSKADAYYKPDFYVILRGGRIHFHEIKGHMQEAGRLRLLAAVRQYREFGWHLWTRDGRWREDVL